MLRSILFISLALANIGAYGATCDRACLKTTLDQHLTAIVRHDPAAAPLFQRQPGTAVRMVPNWPPFDGNWPILPPEK